MQAANVAAAGAGAGFGIPDIPNRNAIVSSGGFRYKIRVRNHLPHYYSFYIGESGADICLSVMYRAENPGEAELEAVNTNDLVCDMDGRGGNTQLMIILALQYITSIFPQITRFTLCDASLLFCQFKTKDRKWHNHVVKMASYYIAKWGGTWYEIKFGARMINPEEYEKYRESLKFLTDPDAKVPEDDFFDSFSDINPILRPYYERAATYREFFQAIPQEFICPYVAGWLTQFIMMNDVEMNSCGWEIPMETLPRAKMEVAEFPAPVGGRRSRARRARRVRRVRTRRRARELKAGTGT